MRGYNVKRLASICRKRIYGSALRTDYRKCGIDKRHNSASEKPGCDRISGYRRRFFYIKSFYCVYNNYTERKAGKRVHCVVSVKKALKKRIVYISRFRRKSRNRTHRFYKCGDCEQCKTYKKHRCKYFTYPCKYFSRSEREPQHRRKEHKRKCPYKPFCRSIADERLYTYGKGSGSATRYSKKRSYRKIKRARKKYAVSFPYPAAEFKQTVAAAHAERSHAKKRNSDARYQKAYYRLPYICPCRLPHKHRKNKVSCSEKQSEKHATYGKGFG